MCLPGVAGLARSLRVYIPRLYQWIVDKDQELIELVRSGHTVNEAEWLPHPPNPWPLGS
jgi:hypothetical protein